MRIATLFTLICLVGCSSGSQSPRPVPPPPEIEVKRTETDGAVSLCVVYANHSYEQNKPPFVFLNTVEGLKEYKKKVQFLISQLDEAEKKMETYEQSRKK